MLSGNLKIVAYEFYFLDPARGYEFLGILPERRKDPKRINSDSIRKWGMKLKRNGMGSKELSFTQVTIDRDKDRIIRPKDSL
jgi:hypothetical protein